MKQEALTKAIMMISIEKNVRLLVYIQICARCEGQRVDITGINFVPLNYHLTQLSSLGHNYLYNFVGHGFLNQLTSNLCLKLSDSQWNI